MTTSIDILETIQKWLKSEVCSQFKFKKPNDDNISGYNYETVNPDVFLMFPPTRDVNDNKAVVPSITVQFDKRTDLTTKSQGVMHVRLNFATWDPGVHANGEFQRNVEGWRDVLNFVEATLREIENTEYIDNIRIIKEREIESGPLSEQGAIIDFYPYWFSYISFYCEFRVVSTKKKYSELL
ncbi:MAG: hypothetical protein IJ681_00450 [Bacteroidales bacterium]|nr:hypothetical protein [Bacteroidales bacterium]